MECPSTLPLLGSLPGFGGPAGCRTEGATEIRLGGRNETGDIGAMVQAPDKSESYVREGEISVELPAQTDEGVYFIGRTRAGSRR